MDDIRFETPREDQDRAPVRDLDDATVTTIEKATDVDRVAGLDERPGETVDDAAGANAPRERTAERDERGRM